MNSKKLFSIVGCLLVTLSARCENWSLQQCLDYAQEHSLTLRQADNAVKSAEEDLKQSKAAFAPSISASSTQALSYSPLFRDGQFAYSANYNVGMNMTLIDGGQMCYSKKMAAMTVESKKLGLLSSQKELEMNILKLYLQVLYAHEALQTSEHNMELAEADLERTKLLHKAGKISKSELAQVEAQWSQDQYSLIANRNALRTSVMNLKHQLELEIDRDFDVETPDISELEIMVQLPDMMDVYNRSMEVMPQIKQAKMDLQTAEMNIKSARSGWYPTVTLGANIGGSYNTLRLPDESLGDQFVGSLGPSVNLGINIPIYNRRQTRTAVNKAKIAEEQSQIAYDQAVKNIATYVESLYIDTESAQANYVAAKQKLASAEESYRQISEQHKAGMRNTVELLTARQTLISAQDALMRSRYEAVISLQLLNVIQDYPIHVGAQ